LFDSKGVFTIKNEGIDAEEMGLEMIDAGAEDFEVDDEIITITCPKENFGNVSKKLGEMSIEPEESGLKRVPNTTKTLDIESAKKVLKFIEVLEDDDDVQNVYHNLEITDELVAEF
jgi:transcriptional/translational regulatory protein YebC/TACO1